MCLKEYKGMWKAHLRPWSGFPLFPRDMSSRDTLTTNINGVDRPTPLNRSTVISEKQYIQSLSSIYQKKDCYVSVFSDWQIENRIYDTLFFELKDAHPPDGKFYDTMEEAMSEIMFGKHILERKLDQLGVTYRCFFTGGRGFHYFLDFEPSFIKYYKGTITKFLEDQGLLDLVDTAVLEDARISRIPYTLHLKTGNYAVYTNGTVNSEMILKASKENIVLIEVPSEIKDSNILQYLDLDIEPPVDNGTTDVYDKKDITWFPDCVINIMAKIEINQHATHQERRHLVGYLRRFGYSNTEMIDFFRNTSDFQYDICLSQIESLDGYFNESCRNVRLYMKDLCPGICDYIRSVAKRKDP